MYEEEIYQDKDFEPSDSRFNLLDGLIRLLEVRLEELERRLSLLESVTESSRGRVWGPSGIGPHQNREAIS